MFGLIRLLIGCIFFLCVIYVIKKKMKISRKKWYVFSAIVAVLLCYLLEFVPFENAIITFSSPESVYQYVTFGNIDVKMVVDGKNSDLVVGGNTSHDTYLIVPKSDDGWKVGVSANTKRIMHTLVDGIVICVYQYANTEDYYITIFNSAGGTIEITDSHDSKFVLGEKFEEKLDKTYVTYYAYIQNFNQQYMININGKEINLLDL